MVNLAERYDALHEASYSFACARENLLRATGWQQTTNNPMHLVVWIKRYNDQILMASLDLAVKMQCAIDDQPEV